MSATTPKLDTAVYEKNRASCRRKSRFHSVTDFLNWAEDKMRKDKWSPDVVVGFARLHGLYDREAMVCTQNSVSLHRPELACDSKHRPATKDSAKAS